LTTPRDEQRASLSQGQAALFAALADVTPIGIVEYLGDGDPRAIAQITASVGAERRAVLAHVDALRAHGVLDSHHDTAFTRYDVKDVRILQLLALADEIISTRESRPSEWLSEDPVDTTGWDRCDARLAVGDSAEACD
jgi:DNA-binding transcriptional ArsR family regulator